MLVVGKNLSILLRPFLVTLGGIPISATTNHHPQGHTTCPVSISMRLCVPRERPQLGQGAARWCCKERISRCQDEISGAAGAVVSATAIIAVVAVVSATARAATSATVAAATLAHRRHDPGSDATATSARPAPPVIAHSTAPSVIGRRSAPQGRRRTAMCVSSVTPMPQAARRAKTVSAIVPAAPRSVSTASARRATPHHALPRPPRLRPLPQQRPSVPRPPHAAMSRRVRPQQQPDRSRKVGPRPT